MTYLTNTTITNLFRRRERIDFWRCQLYAQLDYLEAQGMFGSEQYGIVDATYDRLHTLLADVDTEIASVEIEDDESDRAIISDVAERRAKEDDGGMSEMIAAKLQARV